MRTGFSGIGFLAPKTAPANTSGVDTPNHMLIRAKNVPNGMAEDDCCPQTNRLRTNSITNKTHGTSVAVCKNI